MDDYVNLNHNKTSVERITTLKGSFNQVYIYIYILIYLAI